MTITSDTSAIYNVTKHLPPRISGALSRLSKSALDKIEEIRLRSGGIVTLTISGESCLICESGITKNCSKPLTATREEIEDFIYKICKGSVYSYENSLSDFYITVSGIRIGISGEGHIKNGELSGVGNIYGINIRLPRHIDGCAKEVMEHISTVGFPEGKGVLVASPPGHGKTTLLRDLAKSLSCCRQTEQNFEMKKVCVIDERSEIFMDKIFDFCNIDFLTGIDKVKSIEIASRVLSPQIIICDEIGSCEEAERIRRQKNSGTVFIASVHADSAQSIMKKDYLKRMFDEGVFGYTYLLNRNKGTLSGKMIEYTKDHA